jgi:hypothetical protein
MRRADVLAVSAAIAFCEINNGLLPFVERNGIIGACWYTAITTTCLGKRDAFIGINHGRSYPFSVRIKICQCSRGACLDTKQVSSAEVAVTLSECHFGGSNVDKAVIIRDSYGIKRAGTSAAVTSDAGTYKASLILPSRRANKSFSGSKCLRSTA